MASARLLSLSHASLALTVMIVTCCSFASAELVDPSQPIHGSKFQYMRIWEWLWNFQANSMDAEVLEFSDNAAPKGDDKVGPSPEEHYLRHKTAVPLEEFDSLGLAQKGIGGSYREEQSNHGGEMKLIETKHRQICDNSVQQYSGYFKLTTGDKHYFYWFFESRNKPMDDPVLLWMTGGPGCSSEVALFGENGPCSVNREGNDTINNPYSWNSKANIIYIDQPVGTGFSYGTGYDYNERGVARDMYDFLLLFFEAHSEYKSNDFFVVGESYAGHYIPAVSHHIWSSNKKLNGMDSKIINLKGVAIGNGLTAPAIQYKYYPDMAISTNNHKAAVNKIVYGAMVAATVPCIAAIKACDVSIPGTCFAATELCNLGLLIPYQLTGLNPYDMREECKVPPLCYDFSNVEKYLAREDVRELLGVGDRSWTDCNHLVALTFALAGDWMHHYEMMLPDLLNDGIQVLIYAGDQDYICNWLGNQAWTREMNWSHKVDFNHADVDSWISNEREAGTLQSSHGFTFLRIYDAGHMVPRDQPQVALDMINRFISNNL